jgi:hypothetical protein
MKYSVEFEVRSDNTVRVQDVLHKALVEAFGSADNLRVLRNCTYIGVFQADRPIVWQELSTK